MSSRRFIQAALCAVAAVVSGVLAPGVAAHSPTGGEGEYADNSAQTFWFEAGTPGWVITAVDAAVDDDFEISNNSRTPNFTQGTTGAKILYKTNAQTPDTDECPASFWYACTDYNGGGDGKTTWKSTTFNSENPAGALVSWFCDDPLQADSGCFDMRRMAIHEAGHGVGLARLADNGHGHQATGTPVATTVMQTVSPTATAAGWNARHFGSCDFFELSREYDVVSFAGAYTACVDHLTGVGFSGGKLVSVTRLDAPPINFVCIGQGVTLTGYLKLTAAAGADADGQLHRLAGNGLGARTIAIFRRASGGAYGGTPYTTATVVNAESGTWSRSVGSGVAGTWYFRANFNPATPGDVATLNSSQSAEFSITWSNAC